MKQKKSTIRFLKTVKKNAAIPGKKSGLKKVGRSKPKKHEDEEEMEDVELESENENVINLKVPSSSVGKTGTMKK